jgi:hypothetical protein
LTIGSHEDWWIFYERIFHSLAISSEDIRKIQDQGLVALDRPTGRIGEALYHDQSDFLTLSFATIDNQAMVMGPKAVYAFSCL